MCVCVCVSFTVIPSLVHTVYNLYLYLSFLQVEALIASQANATGFNVSGHTPLDLASEHGHANVSNTICIVGPGFIIITCVLL